MSGGVRLLERWIPLEEVNLSSEIELSFRASRSRFKRVFAEVFGFEAALAKGVPQVQNVHVWFARRPAGSARVLTAAAVLPESVEPGVFAEVVGLSGLRRLAGSGSAPVLYAAKPDRRLLDELVRRYLGRGSGEVVVVDPMAGGGSIPLESLRLGFRTVAVDYNPVAYLILKATVEFPARYADAGLYEETARAARWLLARAREELSAYYSDCGGYVFARGVRCPRCGGLIPVHGVPQLSGDRRVRRRFLRVSFDRSAGSFAVETSDEGPGWSLEVVGGSVRCPYCGGLFQLRGHEYSALGRWLREHARLMKAAVEGSEEEVAEAEGRLLELHIPLVRQDDGEFTAIWGDEGEMGRFHRAFRDLAAGVERLREFIPLDEVPAENGWAGRARGWGLSRWYMLFNPRQLLAVSALSRAVAEVAERLASSNGEFGAAVALYLALAVDKVADYNTVATHWQGSGLKAGIAHTMRGVDAIDFRLEYAEAVPPYRNLPWALELDVAESGRLSRTAGGILPVLRFLVGELRGAGLGGRVEVYLGDATRLSEVLGEGSVDVVNVDPPYFDQVVYSDRSEFFWVVLRRALKPVLELLFKPGLRLSGWSWESPTVPREREVVARDREDSAGRFRRFFREFAREAYRVLRGDGVLVLWFTHPSYAAWRVVGEALYDAGFVVTRVWSLKAESKTRLKTLIHSTEQEEIAVVVARKKPRARLQDAGSLLSSRELEEAAREAVRDAVSASARTGEKPTDLVALVLGSTLATATKFEPPGRAGFEALFKASAAKVVEALVEELLRRAQEEAPEEAKLASAYAPKARRDPFARAHLALWLLTRFTPQGKPRSEPLTLNQTTARTLAELLGYNLDALKRLKILEEEGGGLKVRPPG